MNAQEKQAFIRHIAVENRFDPKGAKIYWSRHAITEAVQDDLTRPEVEATLENGDVIEDYPTGLCPTCGGTLKPGLANIPFIFDDTVIVVKNVPAEICRDCHEPFLAGSVTDQVMSLLNQLRTLQSEVSVVAYSEPETV